MSNVLCIAEARGGALRRVALEVTTAARALADARGGQVHAVVYGAPGIGAAAGAPLGAHGADQVTALEHAAYAQYAPESLAAEIATLVRATGAGVVLCSASAHGKDLAPRVAAKLGVPLVGDATELRVDGDALVGVHPGYTGKVLQTLRLVATPAVASLRPGAVVPQPATRAGAVSVVAPAADPTEARVRVTETLATGGAKLDLGEAPVIVAGGRGLKAAEHFALLEQLADAFGNAAVGATRAVTDDGWRPHADQIGQTGRLVSPDLYVAVGISGAIQHLAGMRTSRTIVAINKDAEAPIFKVADYGVVGDALEIVPELTKAVRAAKG
jgi:electron transfer flavoprotein alpha subunit